MVSVKYLLEKRRGAGGRGGGGSIGGGGSKGSSSGSKGGTTSGGSSSGSNTGSNTGSGGRPPPYSAGSPPPYSPVGGSNPGFQRSGTFGSTSSLSSGPSSYGSRNTFSVPPSYPFAGRQVGGGLRSGISSRGGYGSGYPLVAGAAIGGLGYYGVSHLGFPYGYWPLYIGPHYYGDDEYGPHTNSSRPGGPQVAASFSPAALGARAPPQYLVLGDRDSVSNVTEAIVTDCGAVIVVDSTPLQDDGTYGSGVNTTLLPPITPSNVEAYYRASSFALYSFFEGQQNNSEALVNYTEPAVPDPVYYYPADQVNSTFATCVNQSISTWLPIQAAQDATTTGATSGATPLALSATARRGSLAMLVGVLALSGLRPHFVLLLALLVCAVFMQ